MISKRDFLGAAAGALAMNSLPGFALPPAFAPVRKLMADKIAAGRFPGAVWLIARGDDVIADATGVIAIGDSAPMRRDAIFRIASMTKPITAACVMMLVEDGKIDLQAPVEKYLPELARRKVLKTPTSPLSETIPPDRPFTVHELLNFTSGDGILFDPDTPIMKASKELRLVLGEPNPMTPYAPDDWIKHFAKLPLIDQPGAQWRYNVGSLLQGVLVRRASGQSFEDFVQDRITGPLGMKDTAFFVPPEKLHRFAGCGYFTDQSGAKTRMDKDGAESEYATPPAFASGAGGLCSTADDFLIFARMLLNKGAHMGKQILRPESVAAMTRDQLTPEQKAASANNFFPGFFEQSSWGYGVGVSVADDAIPPRGGYGWDGGFGTSWFNDPSRNMAVIVLTQSSDFLFDGSLDAFRAAVHAATT